MKFFKAINVYMENQNLKEQLQAYEIRIKATEDRLTERVNDYRSLLGERELLREKASFLDHALYKANKTIERIIEVAESNDCGNNKNKIKKIIELAKFEDHTSSIR